MNIRVDLSPKSGYCDVVVVIDVLRTCTIAPLLFDHGLRDLYLCSSIRKALRLAQAGNVLLIGERRGLPPEGFNYGNSPAELWRVGAQGGVRGRSAVLVSENAPRILSDMSDAKHLLLGSLYNADAVVERALSLAESEVALVCAGFRGFEDLDDALCAGYLAARLKRRFGDAALTGAASMCAGLLKAFPLPLEALWHSSAGRYLRALDLNEDIAVGSLLSRTGKVPRRLEVLGDEGDSAPLHRFRADDLTP